MNLIKRLEVAKWYYRYDVRQGYYHLLSRDLLRIEHLQKRIGDIEEIYSV